MYAFTLVPFFFVYFETAFFFGVFFVALPSAAPRSPAIKGIGMAQHRQDHPETLKRHCRVLHSRGTNDHGASGAVRKAI